MDLTFIAGYAPLLLNGLKYTLILTVVGTTGALLVGLFVGVLRTSSNPFLSSLAVIWIEGFRNVPVIIQMFFLYFALGLDSMVAATAGLILYTSGYMAEIVRSAITSIPRGTFEAAGALSLSRWQTLRFITIPLAVSYALPAITTELVNVLKNSAVAMTISVTELSFSAREIEVQTFRGFESATVVTLLYLCVAGMIVASTWYFGAWLSRRHGTLPVQRISE